MLSLHPLHGSLHWTVPSFSILSLCWGRPALGTAQHSRCDFPHGESNSDDFFFFMCLEMISRISCSHSRDGGEADQPVVPWILLLAVLEDRSGICFPAGCGYFSTSSYGALTALYEEAEVCPHKIQCCALAPHPPSLQDSEVYSPCLTHDLQDEAPDPPVSSSTQQPDRLVLAQTCLNSCRPSVFPSPKAKWLLFPESQPVLTRTESSLVSVKRQSIFTLLPKKPGLSPGSPGTDRTNNILDWLCGCSGALGAQENGSWAVGSLLVWCPVILGMVTVQDSSQQQQAGFCFPTAAVSVWSPP